MSINGNTGTTIVMPTHRVETKPPRRNDASGYLHAWEVGSVAINSMVGVDDACRIVAAARLAHERWMRIVGQKSGKVWGFPVSSEEVEALARAERLFGSGHPEAEMEVVRLDALMCKPYADEVAYGLFEAVRWLGRPTNIVRFGFSAKQGW